MNPFMHGCFRMVHSFSFGKLGTVGVPALTWTNGDSCASARPQLTETDKDLYTFIAY